MLPTTALARTQPQTRKAVVSFGITPPRVSDAVQLITEFVVLQLSDDPLTPYRWAERHSGILPDH